MRTWALLLLLSFPFVESSSAESTSGRALALSHVTLIDGTGAAPRPDMTVVLEGERIADVFRSGAKPLPQGAEEIDLDGRFLIPGLISTHVHFDQIGLGRNPERIRRELRRMLYGGVTSAFSAAGDARLLGNVQRSLVLDELLGPDLYYTALMAGPDFMAHDPRIANSSQGVARGQAAWAQTVTRETDPAVAVARALGTHASALKFYVGVDADVIRAMTELAHRHGLKAWAHSTVFPDRPIDVVRAGVDVLSHVGWLAWQDADLDPSTNVPYTHTDPLNPRPTFEPAVVEADSPEMALLFEEMARRGTILDTTASVFADRPGAAHLGEMRELAVELLRGAHRAGVRLATGTDYFLPEAEPFPSVLREVEFLVGEDVLTPLEAITAATFNGARAIGIEETHGSIAPGKVASLVVLRDDPTRDIRALRSVETVIKSGRRHARVDYEAERRRDGSSDTAREERAVRETLAAEQQAFASGDCDAALQFYAEAEPLFVTGGRVIPTRRNLLLACGSMAGNRPGTREVAQEDVIVLGPSTAYSVTRYVNDLPGPDGTSASLPSVVTKLWAKQGDAWRIVHFHESSGRRP